MERLVVCLYTLLMFLFAVALGVAILYHCYKLSDCLRVHARCRRAGLSLLPHLMCFHQQNGRGPNSTHRGPLTRLDSDLDSVHVPPWTVSGHKNCCDGGNRGRGQSSCVCTFTVSPVLRLDCSDSLTLPGTTTAATTMTMHGGQSSDLLQTDFDPAIYGQNLLLPPPSYAEAVRSAK